MTDPTPADDELTPVERLIAECLERFEKEGDGALERVCAEHPDLAPALREQWATLRDAGLLESASSSGDSKSGLEHFPERLGDFRLLRRLGGGGMGVVYLARQETLGREVALKLIRPEHLFFPGVRERFRREVAAVARMQHPGIVPIFAVGQERGVPFFAMERIAGASLADVLEHLMVELKSRSPAELRARDLLAAVRTCTARHADETPPTSPSPTTSSPTAVAPPRASDSREPAAIFEGSWVEACLRVARQVAEALEHAHVRGVLHRDVKPSNVMLTPEGRVVLLDFGLARTEGTTPLTRSDSQPGSLPYMAPERILEPGAAQGARGDVYSLGVTLYEMLTLQPAFASDSSEELRRRILAGDPPRPRDCNAVIPWDAETVCVTAMERAPERRYASAGDFARDLGNALAQRPIEARRAGAALRLLRLAQRHPRATTAALVAALLGGGSAGLLAWQKSRSLDELQKESQKVRAANLATDAANRSLQEHVGLAEFAFGMLTDVLDEVDPFLASQRLPSLVAGLKKAARSISENRTAPPLARARPMVQLGAVFVALGDVAQAQALLVPAMEILRAHLPPDALELAEGLSAQGLLLRRTARLPEARELLEEALDIRRAKLPADHPLIAASLNDLATALMETGSWDDAQPLMEEALEIQQRVHGEESPETARYLGNLGLIHLRRDRASEAEPLLRQARDLWKQKKGAELQLARATADLALAEGKRGRLPESERLLRESLALFESQVGPDHPFIAHALTNLGEVLLLQQENEEAGQRLEAARAMLERIGGESTLVEVLTSLGRVRFQQGRAEEAVDLQRQALELLRSIPGASAAEIAFCENALGVALLAFGELDEAEELLRSALAETRRRFGSSSLDYATQLLNLAEVESDLGRYDDAERDYVEAITVRKNHFRAEEDPVVLAQWSLVELYLRMERVDEAVAILRALEKIGGISPPRPGEGAGGREQAAVLVRFSLDAGVSYPAGSLDLASSCLSVGMALVPLRELERAETLLAQARTIRRGRLGEEHWLSAQADVELAACLGARGRRDEAEAQLLTGRDRLLAQLGEGHPLVARAQRLLDSLPPR